MYRRGFSTLGCVELSLDAAWALGVTHGLDRLELRGFAGSLDLPAALARAFGSPAGLTAWRAKTSASIVSLDTSGRLMDEGDMLDELLAHAPWAEAAGARWLRVFDGGKALDPAELERAATRLRRWREVRRERGLSVDVTIETHDTLLGSTRIKRFLAATSDEKPALLWDTHHTWRKGGEAPLETWQEIGAAVVHIHVKDSRRTSGTGWAYVLPGEGEFPMADLRGVLAREFPGTVSLEWERHWHPDLPPLAAALATAKTNGWW